jgi:hypothetical protein
MIWLKAAWATVSGGIWKYVILIGSALAIVFAALWKAVSLGETKAENREAQQTLRDVSAAKDVQAQVESLPSGRAQKELADKWARD